MYTSGFRMAVTLIYHLFNLSFILRHKFLLNFFHLINKQKYPCFISFFSPNNFQRSQPISVGLIEPLRVSEIRNIRHNKIHILIMALYSSLIQGYNINHIIVVVETFIKMSVLVVQIKMGIASHLSWAYFLTVQATLFPT